MNFEEALGIIENLKQFEQVKIILIAHSGEIRSEDKDIYDKFKEKVIDRIFEVTEHSNSIKWDRIGKQEFIANFLSQHNVKNLRTLQKARCFLMMWNGAAWRLRTRNLSMKYGRYVLR